MIDRIEPTQASGSAAHALARKAAHRPEWPQRIGGYSMLPNLIRRLHADPHAVLAAAGLAGDALDDSDGTIVYSSLGRLAEEAAARTACPHFGLLAGSDWRSAHLGIVGELARNCRTMGEAIQCLIAHQHLNSGGGLTFLLRHETVVDFGYAIYDGGFAGADQVFDTALAIAVQLLREWCGPHFVPVGVLLAHERPADVEPYRKLFRITPRFDAEYSAIRLSTRWLDHPVVGADAGRYRAALRRLQTAPPPSLVQQAMRATRTLLLTGSCAGDEVAQMLSLNRRTLNRRLNEEGTTFQRVLDRVRFEVACQLLASSDISLTDIAATLGYSGVSSFLRFFRRLSGTSPDRWRRAAS